MQRIDGPTAVLSLPVPGAVAGTPGFFTGGDPAVPTPPTVVTADWANMVQEELCYVVEQAGFALNKGDHTQLFQALNHLFALAGGGAGGVTSVNSLTGAVVLTIAALGGVPIGRLLTAGGLLQVDGGASGDLSADRTLLVPKANGAAVLTGTDDASAITPKALHDAYATVFGYNGSRTAPDGFIDKWGYQTEYLSSEHPFSVSFDVPFPNACLGCHAIVVQSSASIAGDYTIQEIAGTLSSAGVTFMAQNEASGTSSAGVGVRWRAWGH
jgi:hypothetical protein